jgi:hypothetical protein
MRSHGGVADGPTLFPILTAAENAVQRRSHLESLLNVPRRVRLRGFLRLGLAGQRFEQPRGICDSYRGASERVGVT